MKRFMIFYAGGATDDEKASANPADAQPMMEAWGKWVAENSKSIIDYGAPLGKTTRVDLSGVTEIKNQAAAYIIVEASSKEAAASMFKNHPHLKFFKGNWIEIMECLPMPTQN